MDKFERCETKHLNYRYKPLFNELITFFFLFFSLLQIMEETNKKSHKKHAIERSHRAFYIEEDEIKYERKINKAIESIEILQISENSSITCHVLQECQTITRSINVSQMQFI